MGQVSSPSGGGGSSARVITIARSGASGGSSGHTTGSQTASISATTPSGYIFVGVTNCNPSKSGAWVSVSSWSLSTPSLGAVNPSISFTVTGEFDGHAYANVSATFVFVKASKLKQ